MTNITKEIIENKLTEIILDNKKSLVESGIIEGISHKDGHVQISLYANKENVEEKRSNKQHLFIYINSCLLISSISMIF